MTPLSRACITNCVCILYSFMRYSASNNEIRVKDHSRSLKMVPFKSLGMVSYLLSIATVAISLAVSAI